MLQVWPSIWIRSDAFCLHRGDRLVERARRFRPQRVAVEVEVHVLEDDLLHDGPDDVDVHRGAGGLAVLRAGDGYGHGHRAFGARRGPRRVLCRTVRQRARSEPPSCRSPRSRSSSTRRTRPSTACPLQPCTGAVRFDAEHVIRLGRWRRRRWGWRRWRRRHVDADAGVIPDARPGSRSYRRRHVAELGPTTSRPSIPKRQFAPAPAKKPPLPCHVSPTRKMRRGVRGRYERRKRAVLADEPRGAAVGHIVELRLAVQFGGEAQALPRREPGADAPAEAVRQIHVVGIAPEDDSAEAGQLDALVDFFAER